LRFLNDFHGAGYLPTFASGRWKSAKFENVVDIGSDFPGIPPSVSSERSGVVQTESIAGMFHDVKLFASGFKVDALADAFRECDHSCGFLFLGTGLNENVLALVGWFIETENVSRRLGNGVEISQRGIVAETIVDV
jgi:hypothetical protein